MLTVGKPMWVHISLVLVKLQRLSMSMLEPSLMDLLQQLSATVKQSAIVEQFATVEQFVVIGQSIAIDMLTVEKPSLVLVQMRQSMSMLEPSLMDLHQQSSDIAEQSVIVVIVEQFVAAELSIIVDMLTVEKPSLVLAKLQQLKLSMSMQEPSLMDLHRQSSAIVEQSVIVVIVEQFVAAELSIVVDMLTAEKPS
jgi:UDP-3-O-[3-hydroxymyristoyl] glucosamine N-acyltransferase